MCLQPKTSPRGVTEFPPRLGGLPSRPRSGSLLNPNRGGGGASPLTIKEPLKLSPRKCSSAPSSGPPTPVRGAGSAPVSPRVRSRPSSAEKRPPLAPTSAEVARQALERASLSKKRTPLFDSADYFLSKQLEQRSREARADLDARRRRDPSPMSGVEESLSTPEVSPRKIPATEADLAAVDRLM